jgi:hypothetical protein
MSGTQMFLVIGGITIFSILVLNVNKAIAFNEEQKISAEMISAATSVGQGMIDEISSKYFDHALTPNTLYNTGLLTPPSQLGPEAGESYADFNDVDDYNDYTRTEILPRAGEFNINVKVDYVHDTNLNQVLTVKSRTKRIHVQVSSLYIDTLNFYYYKCF